MTEFWWFPSYNSSKQNFLHLHWFHILLCLACFIKPHQKRIIMELQKNKELDLKGLITNFYKFDEIEKAYMMLDTTTEGCLQTVIDFT